jgi:hypothetical protein
MTIQNAESHSQPVHPVRYSRQMPPPPLPNAAGGSQKIILSQPWPLWHNYVPAPSQTPQPGIGPYIATPGRFGHVEPIPDFFGCCDHLQAMPVYQESHMMYDEMRTYFANQAYKTQNCELVVVKVLLMVLKPGRVKAAIVEVCAV